MFELRDGTFGVLHPNTMDALLRSVASRRSLFILFRLLFGSDQVLECRGLLKPDNQLESRVVVSKLSAMISGEFVYGENVASEEAPMGSSVLIATAEPLRRSLSDEAEGITETSYEPTLSFLQTENVPRNAVQLAKVTRTDRVRVDPMWWPNVWRIDADDRGVSMLHQLQEQANCISPLPSSVRYVIDAAERFSWREVLPVLWDWAETTGLIRERLCRMDCQEAVSLLAHFRVTSIFPSELSAIERKVRFSSRLIPIDATNAEQPTFRRPEGLPESAWLAAAVQGTTSDHMVIAHVEPARGCIKLENSTPTLLCQWADSPSLTVHLEGGSLLAAAVYY